MDFMRNYQGYLYSRCGCTYILMYKVRRLHFLLESEFLNFTIFKERKEFKGAPPLFRFIFLPFQRRRPKPQHNLLVFCCDYSLPCFSSILLVWYTKIVVCRGVKWKNIYYQLGNFKEATLLKWDYRTCQTNMGTNFSEWSCYCQCYDHSVVVNSLRW